MNDIWLEIPLISANLNIATRYQFPELQSSVQLDRYADTQDTQELPQCDRGYGCY